MQLAPLLQAILVIVLGPPRSPEAVADPPAETESEGEGEADPEEGEAYRTEVVVGRDAGDGLGAQRALSRRNIGFVTAIDLEAEPGRPPADDLGRVLSRAPGVTVRSIGGLGQFSAVSLRGSSSLQVPIFLDGAPLTGSLSGIVDLSTTPLDALARVEIYRGHVPVRYGPAALGGAIDLVGAVHRGPPRLWLAGGFGSFSTREARAGFALSLRPRLSLATRVGYAGSKGDFPHFDDAGTPLLDEDDGFRRRLSNGYDRVFAQVRVDHRSAELRASSQLLAWWKQQDIPGTSGDRRSGASQQTLSLRNVSRVRRSLFGPGGYVEWIASLAGEGRAFRDPEGRVGLGADDERARSYDLWISPRLRAPLWTGAFLTTTANVRGEWVNIDEGLGPSAQDPDALASGDARRRRVSAGLGAELEQWLWKRRLALAGAARVDLAASAFAVAPGEGEVDDAGRDDTVIGFSPRLAAKLKLVGGLELRGSVGRYLRFPTLFELFGDRGYLVGNEGLRPEAGTKIDGGLLLDAADIGGRELDLFVQVAGFVNYSEDLIQWVRSGPVVRPVNVAGARLRGLELGASLRAFGRDLALDLNYTLLDTENRSEEPSQSGRPLPGRPRHSLLLRPAVGHRFAPSRRRKLALEPRAFYELEWIAGNFLDLSGRYELPPRVLHSLGLSLRVADRVELAAEGRNLANLRRAIVDPPAGNLGPHPVAIADFVGYPLPGRSFWITLRLDLSLPSQDRKRP